MMTGEALEKFRVFSRVIEMLTGAGYRYIGLDRFARPDDEICRTQGERTLHMKYTNGSQRN